MFSQFRPAFGKLDDLDTAVGVAGTVLRKDTAMPRQRIHHSRRTYDFPERLVRFQDESKLPWAEINRRLDTDAETTRRWRDKDVLPNTRNYAALLRMADSLDLGHLFTD